MAPSTWLDSSMTQKIVEFMVWDYIESVKEEVNYSLLILTQDMEIHRETRTREGLLGL